MDDKIGHLRSGHKSDKISKASFDTLTRGHAYILLQILKEGIKDTIGYIPRGCGGSSCGGRGCGHALLVSLSFLCTGLTDTGFTADK